ncbi:MAG TPA: GNAT family N-acetyltransferase [Vicinamibacterales bacterium]|jgi:GNAT superfamily N-acetyltransferase|nr:GNAT family N-acetyltransferase [Vicinamibacterales bacterium]
MPRQAVRTYLEMTEPGQLARAADLPVGASLDRSEDCPPGVWRLLYGEVGRDYHWVDRLGWTDEEIARYLADPALELWILREGGEPAGYFELRSDPDGSVEIAYFGLLPAFTGRGLGKFMLAAAVERAWALGARRVWLHTSSLDHPSALSNYLARGFSIWKQEVYDV